MLVITVTLIIEPDHKPWSHPWVTT